MQLNAKRVGGLVDEGAGVLWFIAGDGVLGRKWGGLIR